MALIVALLMTYVRRPSHALLRFQALLSLSLPHHTISFIPAAASLFLFLHSRSLCTAHIQHLGSFTHNKRLATNMSYADVAAQGPKQSPEEVRSHWQVLLTAN
jgi:hypothetical protein